jgi:agmatine/peptidylarginine deiminase
MTTRANVWSVLIVASFLATTLLAVSVPNPVLAQTDSIETEQLDLPPDKDLQLPIGLTEEEKTRLHEIGINHIVTAPPIGPVREAAEWEPLTGVLVRYNNGFGLPYEVLREFAADLTLHVLCVASQQTSCYNNLNSNGVNMANVDLLDMATNSIWVRDYGPQIVFANGVWGITDWIYNRPRPLDDDIPWQLGTEWGATVYGSNLVATGGNFMSDGHGNGFSTDMVWNENSGMTQAQIAQDMADYLGLSNYVVVPDISASGIHHIDVWAKLVNEETILVQEVDPGHSLYAALEDRAAYFQTLTNCYGRPYTVVRVYCADIGGGDVAGHINALILNNKAFVPTFGVSSDATALATFAAAMPGYQIFGYDGSWLSDDAIHCRGMEIHDRYMLRVDTNPLQDQLNNDGDYRVTAFIDDRSEAGLVTDSLIVYWRLAGSPSYNAVTMSATAAPDSYYADIPQQTAFTDIDYYVFARDNSDRRETRPMVAPAAWYTFNTGLLALTDTISGHVLESDLTPVQGVLISADNGGGSATTDVLGYYAVAVPDAWSGTVTPTKLDYTFTPTSRSYVNVTANITDEDYTATYVPDLTPPTPDPMTWATVPIATGSTSITMTATTATDTSGVEYYFECTAGGGNDSGWQDDTTYEDTGLTPDAQYTYRVKARDKSAAQNESGWSTAESATTVAGPLFSDDFEISFGNWTNVTGDQDEWYRNQGSTPSNNTGPDHDNTFGTGWYLHMETSSGFANTAGDEVILESPDIDADAYSSLELSFYYHMYGSNIGTLNVDVYDGITWNNGVWSITGQQHTSTSDAYTQATVNLDAFSGTIRLRFRGVAAGGWQGDSDLQRCLLHR